MLDSILDDFKKQTNIECIKEKEKETYTIKISDTELITVTNLEVGVHFFSIIAPLISGTKEDFFIHLMKANYLGIGTGGSIIGLDPDEKYLTLSYPIHYEVNYRIFYDKLEDFVNYLSFWRYEIQNYGSRQV
jgi:hypothetical protein